MLYINIILITFCLNANASLTNAYQYFKLGNYPKTIDEINSTIPKNKKETLALQYLKALTFKADQEYDKAVDTFNTIKDKKNVDQNINFDLAQSHYALNNLEDAAIYFKNSAKTNIKKNESYYYLGYIYSILEQYKKAKYFLAQVIKRKNNITPKLKQATIFQYNEARYYLTYKTKKIKNIVKTKIIPSLEKSIDISPESTLTNDIKKRIQELKEKYNLDPNIMWNGTKLSNKRLKLNFSQTLGMDSNVSRQNDSSSSLQQTKKESMHSITSFNSSYLISLKKRYLIKPEVIIYNLAYNEKENSAVYSNDTSTFSGKINISLEHKLFNKPASLFFGFLYDYYERDYNSIKNNLFYARAKNYIFGEKFSYFKIGKTSLQYKFIDYVGYTETLNTRTHSLILDQIVNLSSNKLLFLYFESDFISNYNDDTQSINSYLIKIDYILDLETIKINMGISTNFTDTKLQKDIRGIEKTITPSIKITRNIGQSISVSLSHDYTKNISLNDNYKYSKNITNFEFTMRF